MKKKSGISLIVLVITILVMIILAGVVIVSLQNDNPIEKAKEAKLVSSVSSARSAISQYTVNAQANILDDVSVEEKMNEILITEPITNENYIPMIGSDTRYIGCKKLDTKNKGEEIKKILGVDLTAITGKNNENGVFFVNPKTGESVFVTKPTEYLEKSLKGKEGYLLRDKNPDDVLERDLSSLNFDYNISNYYYEFKIKDNYKLNTKYKIIVECETEINEPYQASVGIGHEIYYTKDILYSEYKNQKEISMTFEIKPEDIENENQKKLWFRVPRYNKYVTDKGKIKNMVLLEITK